MTQDFHYSLLKLHVVLQFRGLSSPSNMPKASRSFVLSVRLIPIVLKVYNCQISSLTYRYVNSSIKDNVTTVVFFFYFSNDIFIKFKVWGHTFYCWAMQLFLVIFLLTFCIIDISHFQREWSQYGYLYTWESSMNMSV